METEDIFQWLARELAQERVELEPWLRKSRLFLVVISGCQFIISLCISGMCYGEPGKLRKRDMAPS